MRTLIALICLLAAAPALAQPSVREAYEAGDWAYAQSLGEEAGDAASKTYAAEAALAPLILGEMTEADRYDKRTRARTAAGFARAALEIDHDHVRAHLALAAALAYEARYSNPLRAALSRLPQRGRRHIERALELEPGNAWAQAMLGAWHMEIVRRAGDRTFGADGAAGLERYRAASMVAESPAIGYHFALALLASDAQAHGEEAVSVLEAAAGMEAATAFDAAVRERARELLELTLTFRSAAAEEAVRRLEQ